MAKAKRSQFAAFLNVGTSQSPVYERIGEGITDATLNYNPQTVEETYIHQDSGVTEIESYRPTFPMEAACVPGDEVFDFIDGLRQARAVLSDAYADVVLVYLYETPSGTSYPAEQQPVSIQIDSFGGAGGESNRINYTINFRGDPTPGTFDVSNSTFTAASA